MNIFNYATTAEKNWKMNLEEMGSFRPKYTFYYDFSIADWFGEKSIRETYDNVIKSWGGNYEALTEIIMVLNHKSWSFAQRVDSSYIGSRCSDSVSDKYKKVYAELYECADAEFIKRYKKNAVAMSHYYEVTD